jgi:2,5-diketo-D-gluconate reductase A
VTTVPDITMNNGKTIPQFGLGVFQVPPADTAENVLHALELGYRHIDTAEMYRNEEGVGEGIRKSGVPREEIFVTSKLNNGFHRPDDARKAFDGTLEALGFDYVDLFLIHWPLPTKYNGDFVSTWKTMEEFASDGRARSIGVSNFKEHHIDQLLAEATVVPAINQIELHPYLTQDELRAYCASHGIAVQAWSPIAQGDVLDDPTIGEIAARVGKTPAQVVLRWHVERGDIVFPKSMQRARIEENIDIFDFALSAADVAAITALNKNERRGPDPDVFDYIPKWPRRKRLPGRSQHRDHWRTRASLAARGHREPMPFVERNVSWVRRVQVGRQMTLIDRLQTCRHQD